VKLSSDSIISLCRRFPHLSDDSQPSQRKSIYLNLFFSYDWICGIHGGKLSRRVANQIKLFLDEMLVFCEQKKIFLLALSLEMLLIWVKILF